MRNRETQKLSLEERHSSYYKTQLANYQEQLYIFALGGSFIAKQFGGNNGEDENICGYEINQQSYF